MKSLADGLPPEVAAQIHPEWRANEARYWADRDQLLEQYRDRWVAYAAGKVVASDVRPGDVLAAAHRSGTHPFVVCVGRENQPIARMRRASFAYDTAYPNRALPQMSAEFRATSGSTGLTFDQVIPDTGSDASALPWSDCQSLGLNAANGSAGVMAGVGNTSVLTLSFTIWVWLDGREYECQLQADFGSTERILGRDVLNGLDILFRGPAGEVVVNP